MKKTKEIKFRLNPIEDLILRHKAEQAGLSISEYVRRASLGYEIAARLSEKELKTYSMLTKYSDNFRRIGNLYRKGDGTGMRDEVLSLSKEIREHLRKFKS